MVMFLDNLRVFVVATSPSAFIASSFVIKKIGLKKAGDIVVRAGCASLLYLFQCFFIADKVKDKFLIFLLL